MEQEPKLQVSALFLYRPYSVMNEPAGAVFIDCKDIGKNEFLCSVKKIKKMIDI